MKALEIRSLSKRLGETKVLNDISLSVEQGEKRAIIGQKDAGKTTLFNLISGVAKPDKGEILFFGRNITFLPPFRRARLGMARTFQENNLFFDMSLMDNVELAFREGNTRRKAADFLENMGLMYRKNIKIGELSYGEQRQIELMLAMARSPEMILLDEPTAGMSPVEAEIMINVISSLSKKITVLLVEHDIEVALQLADRVTVLHQGEILCEGEREKVKADPRVREFCLGTAEEIGELC